MVPQLDGSSSRPFLPHGRDSRQKGGDDDDAQDLGRLMLPPSGQPGRRTLASLPSVWEREGDIRQRLAGRKPVVFLDYDGTLTPIVDDHAGAFLAADVRDAVRRLSACCPVAIVSGRGLEVLQSLVGLDSVYYAASHGFEISGPEGSGAALVMGAELLPELDDAERELRATLAGIAGHAVERKRLSIAVHYRRVAPGDVDKVKSIVGRVLADHPRLRRGFGKKVQELQPDVDWNKGRAVLWLLDRLGRVSPDGVPVFIGDDVTDEDAFRALAGRGIAIAVRDHGTRPTAAELALADVGDVRRMLDLLIAVAADANEN